METGKPLPVRFFFLPLEHRREQTCLPLLLSTPHTHTHRWTDNIYRMWQAFREERETVGEEKKKTMCTKKLDARVLRCSRLKTVEVHQCCMVTVIPHNHFNACLTGPTKTKAQNGGLDKRQQLICQTLLKDTITCTEQGCQNPQSDTCVRQGRQCLLKIFDEKKIPSTKM